MTYFEIGKRIVEQEQADNQYATYGTFLTETLAKTLTDEFEKGFQLLISNKNYVICPKLVALPFVDAYNQRRGAKFL